MKKQDNVIVNESSINTNVLFEKLKNDLIIKMSMTENAANEQAAKIAAIFKVAYNA